MLEKVFFGVGLALRLSFFFVMYEVNMSFMALGLCFPFSCGAGNFMLGPLFVDLYP